MTRNLAMLLALALTGAGPASADCIAPEQAQLDQLHSELVEVAANLARGHAIKSFDELGYHTTPQRIHVRRRNADGQDVYVEQVRKVYVDPDDPSKPLDPALKIVPIDRPAEIARRDALFGRITAAEAALAAARPATCGPKG